MPSAKWVAWPLPSSPFLKLISYYKPTTGNLVQFPFQGEVFAWLNMEATHSLLSDRLTVSIPLWNDIQAQMSCCPGGFSAWLLWTKTQQALSHRKAQVINRSWHTHPKQHIYCNRHSLFLHKLLFFDFLLGRRCFTYKGGMWILLKV